MSKHQSEQPQAVYPGIPEPDGWYPDEPTSKDKVHFLLDDSEPEPLWWIDVPSEADQEWERDVELARQRGYVW